MYIFEVVRWGNDSPDPDEGGPDGEDTCFLVRAETPADAAELAEVYLIAAQPVRVSPRADIVYLLGEAPEHDREARVIRGPYIVYAINPGWRWWERRPGTAEWVEMAPGGDM